MSAEKIRKWFCRWAETPAAMPEAAEQQPHMQAVKNQPEKASQVPAAPVSEPFAFVGWPDYINPEWPEGYQRTQGISFEIGKECFGNREALLFYRDNSRGIEDAKLYAETIEKYSSGIRVVDVESNCSGPYGSCFTFRLDATTGDGRYVLLVPVSGEFNCELGEEREGHRFPMCKEHFLADSLYALQMDLKHSETDAPHDYRPQIKNIRF